MPTYSHPTHARAFSITKRSFSTNEQWTTAPPESIPPEDAEENNNSTPPEPQFSNSGSSQQSPAVATRPRISYPDRVQLSGELFEAVQHNRVFSDSKQYVDMLSTLLPSTIIAKWKEEKENPDFDLAKFITEHFHLPELLAEDGSDPTSNIHPKDNCREHVRALWPLLFRPPDRDHNAPATPYSSLISLPYPYVVPGGRFRETYYWDSYFTAHGLIADGHTNMAWNMAKNFQYVIQTYGHIPNGNRLYYLSRSQPPFFAPLVSLLAAVTEDAQAKNEIISDFYPEALLEHKFWMDETGDPDRRTVTFEDNKGNQHTLNRFWDDYPAPREESWIEDKQTFEESNYEDASVFYRHVRAACESGWDFSSRWLADRNRLSPHSNIGLATMDSLATIETTNILPVDLNTVLWYCETKLAEWSESLGHSSRAEDFRAMAERRKESINALMWDENKGFYFDYHLVDKKQTNCFSLAAVYPLYFQLANQAQAEAVAEKLEKHFLKDGGLLTTTEVTGQQWDAPNGWAPLHWMAIVGLEHYGMHSLATKIRTRWLQLNEQVYAETGKMVEKYNVMDLDKKGGGGEYPLQDGFGWTNGVFSALSGHLDDRVDSIDSPEAGF